MKKNNSFFAPQLTSLMVKQLDATTKRPTFGGTTNEACVMLQLFFGEIGLQKRREFLLEPHVVHHHTQ